MKIPRFHHNSKLRQLLPLLSARILGVVLLFMTVQSSFAQGEGGDACFFSMEYQINCNNITVRFGGNVNWPTHRWDFGDGSPMLLAPPPVFHTYVDVNPYLTPITARHFTDQWCDQTVEFPGIFLGTGCGSLRKVSQMIATNKLPANELIGKDLYVFGDLEVDVPYIFNGCNIYLSSGGKITVKSNGALTLKNNTVVDLHFVSGDPGCNSLWNGIEVYSGGLLATDGATIKNAYFAIRPIQDNANVFPQLRLKNTTFSRDFIGIYSANGHFALSDFRNNTFEGSGNTALYPIGSCNPQNVLPYAQRTYCGIYFNGSLGGSLLMPNKSQNNLFKDLQAGIVSINATTTIQGCRFDNIAHLPGNTALYQGTAISFMANVGKKNLTIVGLGKTGTATINNCERGIYATSASTPNGVLISNCRMLQVQNGIDIDASGTGNFSKGVIQDNYIGCTKNWGIIKTRSIGILWRDPSILYSNFTIAGNDIDVNQPEAYPGTGLDEDILPTAINVVAMHNQASSNGMLLAVNNNHIDLIKGHQGIVVQNVVNSTISGNTILHDNALYHPHAQVGVYVLGGLNNRVDCNFATQTNPVGAYMTGFACEASPGMSMTRNTADNIFNSMSFVFDNETNCRILYNDLKYNLGLPGIASTALYYNAAQTGPQPLRGNDWIGDFEIGALFAPGNGIFPYCNSLYRVSAGANVANGLNPVDQGNQQTCSGVPTDWFTVIGTEDDIVCLQELQLPPVVKNEADLNLANGGTLTLSPGFKWSSEMGLYRKFTENPGLIMGDPVITQFMQAQQGQPVQAMYGVRNGLNGLELSVGTTLRNNIQNTVTQIETNYAHMLVFLENIETDNSALASFTTLSLQTATLEQTLQSYLASAATSMSQNAVPINNANNGISTTGLPGVTERYITRLYLETKVISPRALNETELENIRLFGLNCPQEAGAAVYLARAWYYLNTGIVLNASCGGIAPELTQDRAAPQEISAVEMELMPNPANSLVSVRLPATFGAFTLTLTDICGRSLIQREVAASESAAALSFPTENFANGIYLVSVRSKSGAMLTKKLAIAH